MDIDGNTELDPDKTEFLLIVNELQLSKYFSMSRCLWYHGYIGYTILLRRRDDWFGVTGKALTCFKSYLTGRFQRIELGDCLSSKADLTFEVPRGPFRSSGFDLHTAPLSSMISGHAISLLAGCHLYAHDSQLYVSFASRNSAVALNGLQSQLGSVQQWMSTNKLKLNPDKTEFLLIGNEQQRRKYSSYWTYGVETNPAKSARNRAVIFDKRFTFHSHISAMCSPCFSTSGSFGIFAVTLIWIVQITCKKLCCLNYWNVPLSGIADTEFTKLQRAQRSPPFTCSVSLLCSLHWSPNQFRVEFKITLHNSSWKANCLSSLHVCHITLIPFTDIKQRNHSIGP